MSQSNISVYSKEGGFFATPNKVFDMGLNPYQITIFCYLQRLTNNETGLSYPSFNKIAEKTGISRMKVVNTIRELCGKGMIIKHPGDSLTSNKYEILTPSQWGSTPHALGVVHEVYQGSTPHIPGVVHQVDSINTKYTNTKDKYLEVVFLSKDEYSRLVVKYSKNVVTQGITSLNNYLLSIGKPRKYRSHYHTLLNWLRKEGRYTAPRRDERAAEMIEQMSRS